MTLAPPYPVKQPASFWFRAWPVKVLDGDTVLATIDLRRVNLSWTGSLRTLAVNAPELTTPDGTPNPPGLAAKQFVDDWVVKAVAGHDWPLKVVVLASPDKWGGRVDAWVYRVVDRHCLSDDLIASGHAVPMPVLLEVER